ncbi:MAG TPA: phosphoribosylanthranilate isomerase [Cyclobacteriaceae bacterium]|jgi:phosphoribosylanthranilate isomerase
MSDLKLKVCGMKDVNNIRCLSQLPIDFIGFIFYKHSPRHVETDDKEFVETVQTMPNSIKKVGVFVNEKPQKILETGSRLSLNVIQLHGEESPATCKLLKKEGFLVIKVIKIENNLPIELEAYENICDYLLFEAKGLMPGGNNKTFDWKILEAFSFQAPVFISGGISFSNFSEALKIPIDNLFALDINSAFEIYPGFKDVSKINKLLSKLKNVPA